jgi:hypothetical protein
MIALAGTPNDSIDVIVVCRTRAPMALPISENRPPVPRSVPPMTTARIASNSVYIPMLFASDVRMFEVTTRPAMPAQKPQKA